MRAQGPVASHTYGLWSVAAVTEMKLQLKKPPGRAVSGILLCPLSGLWLSLFLLMESSPDPLTQFITGMDKKFGFSEKQKKKGRKRGRGGWNQTSLTGELLTEQNYFWTFTYADLSGMDFLKKDHRTKRRAQLWPR